MDLSHYIEIKIDSNPDITQNFIMSILFKKIHESFISTKQNLGISFPHYSNKNLGDKLRIFGDIKALNTFITALNVKNIVSYLTISNVEEIPENVSYAKFIRTRTNSKQALMHRAIKRRGVTLEKADSLYANFNEKILNLPFVNYFSTSTKQNLKIFIRYEENSKFNTSSEFSSFGLSTGESFVPIF